MTVGCRLRKENQCEATGPSSAFAVPCSKELRYLSTWVVARSKKLLARATLCILNDIWRCYLNSKFSSELYFLQEKVDDSAGCISRYQSYFCEGFTNASCPQSPMTAILALPTKTDTVIPPTALLSTAMEPDPMAVAMSAMSMAPSRMVTR